VSENDVSNPGSFCFRHFKMAGNRLVVYDSGEDSDSADILSHRRGKLEV